MNICFSIEKYSNDKTYKDAMIKMAEFLQKKIKEQMTLEVVFPGGNCYGMEPTRSISRIKDVINNTCKAFDEEQQNKVIEIIDEPWGFEELYRK